MNEGKKEEKVKEREKGGRKGSRKGKKEHLFTKDKLEYTNRQKRRKLKSHVIPPS